MAVAESSMLELKMAAIIKLSQEWMSEVYSVQIGWILDGRIQDGCHHQVELEWMSLSQIELVRAKVLCKMAESKITEFKMAELEMAVINKLSQNEWVKFFCANGGEGNVSKFFCANGGNQSWQVWVNMRGITEMVEYKMAKLKMTAIIKLSENDWVWVRLN